MFVTTDFANVYLPCISLCALTKYESRTLLLGDLSLTARSILRCSAFASITYAFLVNALREA